MCRGNSLVMLRWQARVMDRPNFATLRRVAGKQTTRLTHYGRKTGKPHEVTIWFVLDGDRLYIGTANVNRQWVQNVQKTPKIKLSIAGENVKGTAGFLIPWRMLPQELGCGSGMTCWRRLRDWQEAGVWQLIHFVLLDWLARCGQIDWSRAVVDGSSVRAVFGGLKRVRIPPTERSWAASVI